MVFGLHCGFYGLFGVSSLMIPYRCLFQTDGSRAKKLTAAVATITTATMSSITPTIVVIPIMIEPARAAETYDDANDTVGGVFVLGHEVFLGRMCDVGYGWFYVNIQTHGKQERIQCVIRKVGARLRHRGCMLGMKSGS